MLHPLLRACGLVLTVLLLAGCDDLGRINWSPDGKRCAVLSEHDLQIGDDTGALHAEPTLRTGIFEWLPDSKSAIVVTAKKASWSELTKLISATDLKKISTDANHLYLHPNQNPQNTLSLDYDCTVCDLYLKNRYGKPYLSSSLHKLWGDTPAVIYTARVYDFAVSPPLTKTVLLQTARQITAINIAPNGQLEAICEKELDGCKLSVVSTNGKTQRFVSRVTSQRVCWSADSRAVFFAYKDDVGVNGTLQRVTVAGQNGPLLPRPDKVESLATIECNEDTVLQCLPDGRIIFNSRELKVPSLKGEDNSNRSIFILAADGKAIDKLKLPTIESDCNVQTFATNHSGTKLVALGSNGQIWLTDLLTHESTTVQGDVGDTTMAPTWRTDDQFTYAARNKVRSENGHDVEVVLRNANDGSEQIISNNWSTKDVSFLHDEDRDIHKPKANLKHSSPKH
jgi:hypothetical protein